jgi:ABC-type sugar transport system substrate-binding protein
MASGRLAARITTALTALALATAGTAWAQGTAGQNGAEQRVQKTSSATCTDPSPNHAKLSDMIVGFSQSENEQNPFRAGETNSVRDAAKTMGVKRLLYTNANDNQAKQVADIESMIAQGAQAIIVAPINATGLQPALAQAASKSIPVVTIDRQTAGTPCRDFITFMGSDFQTQGVRAAKALADVTGGKAEIAEIQGAYGNSVETQRTDGFAEELKKHPGMHLVAAQTGNWSATDAQRVMEQLLLAHPNINAVYAQADVMAFGALQALKQAGKQPGKDVMVVSIDGTKAAVQDIADGTVAAVVETNPRFGPQAFQALEQWFDGKAVPQTIIMDDALYTKANAAQALQSGAPY